MSAPTRPPEPSGEILLYQTEDGRTRLEPRLSGGSLWLSLGQLAELFQRDNSVIGKHIRNIYATGELSPGATAAKFAVVRSEGRRAVTRSVELYNLDVVLAVGYRVHSHRGIQFRTWATEVYEPFRAQRTVLPSRAEEDFERAIKELPKPKP